METVTQGKSSTAMTPAEWIDYCEKKPGNYQVYIGSEPMLHYPVGYAVAWNAFHMASLRNKGVRLVGAA